MSFSGNAKVEKSCTGFDSCAIWSSAGQSLAVISGGKASSDLEWEYQVGRKLIVVAMKRCQCTFSAIYSLYTFSLHNLYEPIVHYIFPSPRFLRRLALESQREGISLPSKNTPLGLMSDLPLTRCGSFLNKQQPPVSAQMKY